MRETGNQKFVFKICITVSLVNYEEHVCIAGLLFVVICKSILKDIFISIQIKLALHTHFIAPRKKILLQCNLHNVKADELLSKLLRKQDKKKIKVN